MVPSRQQGDIVFYFTLPFSILWQSLDNRAFSRVPDAHVRELPSVARRGLCCLFICLIRAYLRLRPAEKKRTFYYIKASRSLWCRCFSCQSHYPSWRPTHQTKTRSAICLLESGPLGNEEHHTHNCYRKARHGRFATRFLSDALVSPGVRGHVPILEQHLPDDVAALIRPLRRLYYKIFTS